MGSTLYTRMYHYAGNETLPKNIFKGSIKNF